MLAMTVELGEPAFPDLKELLPDQVIHLGNDAPPIRVAALSNGMGGGKTSVAFCFKLPDGRAVVAETSLRLLLTVARSLGQMYPE
jgi:hypothetical protein